MSRVGTPGLNDNREQVEEGVAVRRKKEWTEDG